MDLWTDLGVLGQGIVLAGAAVTALLFLWNRLKAMTTWLGKKSSQLTWAFSEEHDHKVINDKLELLAAGIEEIKSEFKPNGGGSQHDKLEQLLEMAEFQKSFFHATLDSSSTGYFRTDEHGGMVWCNRAYTRMMGVTHAEVYQFGWVNVIDDEYEHDYREKVVGMWMNAVQNKREFAETIHFKKSNGDKFVAMARAFVIKGSYGMFGHFGEVNPTDLKEIH